MNYLPKMKYGDGIRENIQSKFGGLDRRSGVGEGVIISETNADACSPPSLSVREREYAYSGAATSAKKFNYANKLFATEKNVFFLNVSGSTTYISAFDGSHQSAEQVLKDVYTGFPYYPSGQPSNLCSAVIGDRIVIFPDKICLKILYGYSTPPVTVGDATTYPDLSWTVGTGKNAAFEDNKIELKKDTAAENMFNFRDGDYVAVSASGYSGADGGYRIVTAKPDMLIFEENVNFSKNGAGWVAPDGMAITRKGISPLVLAAEIIPLDCSITAGSVTFSGDSSVSPAITANTMTLPLPLSGAAPRFRVGDSLRLEPFAIPGAQTDNYFKQKSVIQALLTGIEYITENGVKSIVLVFDSDTFAEYIPEGESSHSYTGVSVTVSRRAPDLDFVFAHENRVWGGKGDKLYACKLGDPTNWNDFSAADGGASWSSALGTPGDITGGCSYLGYPTFFKENGIYKVYGDGADEYRAYSTECNGIKSGCGTSLSECNGRLVYYSASGFYSYSGNLPVKISDALGSDESYDYDAVVGGSDGVAYHACGKRGLYEQTPSWQHLVYNTRTGLWFCREAREIYGFATVGNTLFTLAAGGETEQSPINIPYTGILYADRLSDNGGLSNYSKENNLPFRFEFSDFYASATDKKGIERIRIRYSLSGADGSAVSFNVRLYYDGEDVGVLKESSYSSTAATAKKTVTVSIIPRRCDSLKIVIDGVGKATVYSIGIQYYGGSDI